MRTVASHLDDFIKLTQKDSSVKGKNFISLQRVLESSPQITLVSGDKGLGKTFLAHQVHQENPGSHFLSGSTGTNLYNFTKFISTQLGIDLSGPQEDLNDRTSSLIASLSQIHENQIIIIDNVDRLPQDTLSTILQIVESRPCIQFILFGKRNIQNNITELMPNYKDLPCVTIQSLSDKEIKQMLLIRFDIKLSHRKFKQLKLTTQGIPGEIVRYIDNEQHFQSIHSKIFTWKNLYKTTKKILLLITICGLTLFSYQSREAFMGMIWPAVSPKNYQFIVDSSSIYPMINDSPKICVPKAETIRSSAREDQTVNSFLPVYAIQLLGVKNPSGIKTIDSSLKKLSSKPILVKKKSEDGTSDWYVLYYGPFFKKEDAQKALSNLPKELKAYNPWLKQISTADIFKE